ncbi:putative cobalamin-5-phosphate synthase [Crocosphaera subtropica ATCC 51142]|uniref:Adenosylcobinamide-GDP ribazoletransferase n=1 Tax=Crocosphaera subtropica (strain ATCC 51142 / BH68) TaxID=43989 RepID=B1WY08_CROS5|nr:adenosylcobinamide-GDP ribazoletransferase [Crocosphaera subtropica]ACB50995.1 putative cobalamin-5-phosphate synthase [Crocosphaera subtropica ATCC 51142]
MFHKIYNNLIDFFTSLFGAITFYTIVPLPAQWPKNFQSIARWSPIIGLGIGGLLGIIDTLLSFIGFPITVRSGLIIGFGIYITGGLHLDGVLDSADGLAVTDPKKRLEVMQDSVTGAFGVMAGVMVILLKIIALSAIFDHRAWGLMAAYGWGRWGQVSAIAFYPYLKPTGKGAFHKQYFKRPQDLLGGLVGLLGMTGVFMAFNPELWQLGLRGTGIGMAIALGVGTWFNHRFGGHTGDTYGAVVEWTETFILCLLSIHRP